MASHRRQVGISFQMLGQRINEWATSNVGAPTATQASRVVAIGNDDATYPAGGADVAPALIATVVLETQLALAAFDNIRRFIMPHSLLGAHDAPVKAAATHNHSACAL